MPRRATKRKAEEEEDEFDFDEREEEEPPKKTRKAAGKRRRVQEDDDDEEEEEEEEEDEEEDNSKRKKKTAQQQKKKKKTQKFRVYRDRLTGEFENDPVDAKVDVSDHVSEKDEARAKELNEDELKALITKMTRYVLFKGSKKVPVFKSKLTGDVASAYKKNRVTTFCLAEAQKILRQVWGYDIVPAPRKSPKEDFKGNVKDALFVVNRSAESPTLTHFTERECKERGFLMVVFSCIASSQEWKIKETELFKHLHALDDKFPLETASPSSAKRNFVQDLGNVVDLFDTFIKQGYLTKDRNAQDDLEYALGPRAYVDVGRNQILQFQADALGHDSVDPTMLKEMQDNAKLDDDDDDESEEEEEEQPAKKKPKKNKTADDADDADEKTTKKSQKKKKASSSNKKK